MRGNFGLLRTSNGFGSTTIGRTTKFVSCSTFSSSSGGGSGSGRGRGSSSPTKFDFVASDTGKFGPDEGSGDSDKSYPPAGRGLGRGKPLPSSPFLPSFNTSVASNQSSQQPGLGQGRGGVARQQPVPGELLESRPRGPIFLKKDEAGNSSVAESVASAPRRPIGEKNLPEGILNVLTGSGRGTPERQPVVKEKVQVENRHLRPKRAVASAPASEGRGKDKDSNSAGRKPKLTREEAVKNAFHFLSKDKDEKDQDGKGRRKRSRRDNDRSGDRDKYDDDDEDEDENEDEDSLFMGDDADGQRLAEKLGPSRMDELTQAFEDMSYDVLPDPMEEEYIEALDTNLKIELEPEYLMGEFEKNPDINENPPIPLREALEKMKPFLMAYEGIESQEEWEEAMKETMDRVPLLKEIVDHYCGPDRVTAKQQHEELERVANTLPASVPNSVKSFTDRAVLSLQSNPGWGFNRKCQYMDKLVNEFSKSYK